MIRKAIRGIGETICPCLCGQIDEWRAVRAERRHWDERIADVLACPDNARLRRAPEAGKIVGGLQAMHNGLKVVVNGYYGDGITRMLAANRGCHEPQEEVVFDAIVRSLPARAVMIEAGAYWGFYSMWFCQIISEARVFLVEPAEANLAVGQRNFQLNGFSGDFTQAYVGRDPGKHSDGTKIVSIESFLMEKGLTDVNILHADVQGFELEMLQGAKSLLDAGRIDYLFISTHSTELHTQCVELLRLHKYRVLVSVNLEETYSVDGVLVACGPRVTAPKFMPPSKRSERQPVASP